MAIQGQRLGGNIGKRWEHIMRLKIAKMEPVCRACPKDCKKLKSGAIGFICHEFEGSGSNSRGY